MNFALNQEQAFVKAVQYFRRYIKLRFCSLFSSSSGNAAFIGSAKTGILIDAGVSAKKLKEALISRELDPSRLSGIFITHEHSDHIKGMRILASTFNIPVLHYQSTSYFPENRCKHLHDWM